MARRLDPRELPCSRPVAGAVRSAGGVAASPANAWPRMSGDLPAGLRMPPRPAPAAGQAGARGTRIEQEIVQLGSERAGQRAHLLDAPPPRSEEHTSELQSLMRISYAVFCLKKKNNITQY